MARDSSSEVLKLKKALDLSPVPLEGGWLRELRLVVTEGQKPLPEQEDPREVKSSSIYYMLNGKEVSRWHRTVGTEEYFCWHRGTCPVKMYEVNEEDGVLREFLLGDPLLHPNCAKLQHLTRAGVWMAAELTNKGDKDYALFSAITVPAFDWSSFQMLDRNQFEQKFSELKGKFDDTFFHKQD